MQSTSVHKIRLLLAVALLAMATACTTLYRTHGYVPLPEDMAQIAVGKTTQEEVSALLGPPAIDQFLAGGAWYYVRSKYELVGWRAPKEVDRKVLAVNFSADGRVSNVEEFGLEQGRVIQLSSRVTENSVREQSVLRQIFSTIGNFSAANALNQNSGGN